MYLLFTMSLVPSPIEASRSHFTKPKAFLFVGNILRFSNFCVTVHQTHFCKACFLLLHWDPKRAWKQSYYKTNIELHFAMFVVYTLLAIHYCWPLDSKIARFTLIFDFDFLLQHCTAFIKVLDWQGYKITLFLRALLSTRKSTSRIIISIASESISLWIIQLHECIIFRETEDLHGRIFSQNLCWNGAIETPSVLSVSSWASMSECSEASHPSPLLSGLQHSSFHSQMSFPHSQTSEVSQIVSIVLLIRE